MYLPPRGGEKPEGIKTPPQSKKSTSINVTSKERTPYTRNTLYRKEHG